MRRLRRAYGALRIAIFTRELALVDRDGEKATLNYAEIA